MTDYRVNLDVFSGPLDLLLYLVRKEEVEIYDIPISRITEEYLRYIDMLKMFDMELAGEFLVMAAALMEIKSAMLLPKDELAAVGEEETFDPRGELIRQLLEYKKFKDAASLLRANADEQIQKYPRSDSVLNRLKPDTEPELDMEQVGVWDLLEAFDAVMKATGGMMDISHITDDTPIDLHQIEVLHRLQTDGPMSFERIFEGRKNRLVMVGLFLSILELTREKLIAVEQEKPDMPIYLRSLTDVPAQQAVQDAIFAQEQETEPAESAIPIHDIQESPVAARQDIEIVDKSEQGN